MKRLHLAVVIIFVLTLCISCAASAFTGKVVGVTDGDTVKVLVNKKEVKVRLDGIDCPEKGQDYGTRAKQFTSKLVFGKTGTVEDKGKDRYGRTLGVVTTQQGKILNELLLSNGLAWWYKQYAPSNKEYERLESNARKAKVGLWSAKNPIPPWEWRSGNRACIAGQLRRSSGNVAGAGTILNMHSDTGF